MNMQRRPLVLGGIALMAAPRIVFPQSAGKVWRVGILAQDGPQGWFGQLKAELSHLGYEEGKNIAFDYKLAQGRPNLLDGFAAELVAANVDVIAAQLNFEIQAAKRATKTIPIVMLYGSLPVEIGLVASLARPGGNVTGTTTNTLQSTGQGIELLREAVPGLRRLTTLAEPEYPGMALYLQEAERACAAHGIEMVTLPVREYKDLDAAFQAMERSRPDAISLSMTGVMMINISRVIGFAQQQRLPALYSTKWPVTFYGGLMSYSANSDAIAKRDAWMIDRIFKGAKPADIPVEEPSLHELTINLKTAKALDLTIPQSLLQRAVEVIA